jgi:hypothetical protein
MTLRFSGAYRPKPLVEIFRSTSQLAPGVGTNRGPVSSLADMTGTRWASLVYGGGESRSLRSTSLHQRPLNLGLDVEAETCCNLRVSPATAPRTRTRDELIALSPAELSEEWSFIGSLLLEYRKSEFLRIFRLLSEADPHASAEERMANMHTWSLVGWVVMNVSPHNRQLIATVIIEAREVLYRAITAREILDLIRARQPLSAKK